MPDPVHLAFPRMTDVSAVTPPNEPGVWEIVHNRAFLVQAADGLEINWDPDLAAQEDLVSTPDVWAQITTFEADLLSGGKALGGTQAAARHARAVGEWRGLLALLALRHSASIDIGGNIVDLRRLAQLGGDASMDFANVVYRLHPTQSLFEGMSWDAISTLRVGRRLVGFFNPATLVAPAKEYAKGLGPAVAWFRGGRLVDPCALGIGLTARQYLVLATFVDKLHGDLVGRPSAGSSSKTIIQLLADYHQSCGDRASTENAEEVLQLNALTTVALPPGQAPYAKLIAAWQVRPNQPARFSTHLPLRPELLSTRGADGIAHPLTLPFKGILLIDPKTEQRTRVAIWGEETLEAILNNNRLRRDVEEHAAREGYVCLEADSIFTDKLYEIVGSAGGVAGHGDSVRNYLLPLAPWMLMFVDPDELRSAVKIAPTADGGQVVTVTLRLRRGTVGESTLATYEHSFSRVYRPVVDIWRREAPPAVTMWPNFVSPDWRFYYVFYNGLLGQHFSLRGPVQGASLRDSLADAWSRSNGEVRQIMAWFANPQLPLQRQETFRKDQRLNELYFQNAPVEALACDCAEKPDNADFVPPDRRIAVGIMLPPRTAPGASGANAVRQISPTGRKMRIGIDFGSSNTIVYRDVDGRPEPMRMEARVVNLMRDVTDAEQWFELHRDCMPVKPPPVPFMTILRSRPDDGSIRDIAPLFKDYQYFIDDGAAQMGTILSSTDSMHFNLKWKREVIDRERTSHFLRQTMLMALAEAVAAGVRPDDVSWRFSYPEAFRQSELDDLTVSYQGQLSQILPPVTERKSIEKRTESEAAALYFNHAQKAFLNQTMIVLDVGGGTTDIAIWHKEKFLWRNSIKVAGGNILLPFLARRPDLVKLVAQESKDLAPMVESWLRKNTEGQARAVALNTLDVIVNQAAFSDAMKRRLPLLTGTGDGLLLRQLVQTAYAGLLFYIALQLEALGNAVGWDDVRTVRLCFAGRGSLLFRDTLGGRAETLGTTTKILPGMLGREFSTPVVFTDDPKHEVAYGLVVDRAIDDSQRVRAAVFGEAMRADGQSLSHKENTASLVGRRQISFDPMLPQTERFATALKKFARIDLNLSRVRDDLVGRCDGAIGTGSDVLDRLRIAARAGADAVGGHEDVTLVEPPFAIVLRELLGLISEAPNSTPLLKDL